MLSKTKSSTALSCARISPPPLPLAGFAGLFWLVLLAAGLVYTLPIFRHALAALREVTR
jgi:hypothetical protein